MLGIYKKNKKVVARKEETLPWLKLLKFHKLLGKKVRVTKPGKST